MGEEQPVKPLDRWNNRALLRLIWPLLIEQLLAVAVGMVDTVMVSSAGESAVSGVSVVDNIIQLLITIFGALCTGGAVVVSQYIGKRDDDGARTAAKQLVYISVVAAAAIGLLTIALHRPMLQLIYGYLEPAVMQNAATYFWISALGFPFLALYNAGAALFRSNGNSRISMLVALFMNVLHVGGNLLLIYGLQMGVAGAAVSTLVSRAAAAVLIIGLLMSRRAGQVHLQGLFRVRLVPGMLKNILRIGVPNGLETSVFHIGKLMVARLMASFGTAALAGNAIGNTLSSLVNTAGNAFGLAMLTVVGQCVGAADYTGAKRYVRKLMAGSIGSMTVLCVAVLCLLDPLIGLFDVSGEAAAFAARIMWLFCLVTPFLWSFSFALPNALRAAGDVRYTMVVSIATMWIFRVACSYLFANVLGFGAYGVWMAMMVDWAARTVLFVWRWLSGRWQGKAVIR